MTIYADVLIILNIYVNFFLLRTTAGITHSPMKTIRCIAASVYGSIYSLLIIFPDIGLLLNFLIKGCAAVTIVMLAFGIHGIKRLFINTVTFFTANFLLAGAVYGVYAWFEPKFMHFCNTYFYIDFSLVILVVTTCIMYIGVCLFRRFADRVPENCGLYRILIRSGKKVTVVDGLADTGNSLTDFFTGCPVIICSERRFEEITGKEYDMERLPKGFRLLPCSTVSEDGLIAVFRPDEIVIENAAEGYRKPVEALVGFGRNKGEAVFNPKILKN